MGNSKDDGRRVWWNPPIAGSAPKQKGTPTGGVYLLKSGPYYKIGKATVFDKRIKHIKLLQPEPVEVIHKIYTHKVDELERYWHQRFANRKKNGEWFELYPEDVIEFKKWSEWWYW